MDEIFDEEEYSRKSNRKYNQKKRTQRFLTAKFDSDLEYRSKIENQAERYLAKLRLSPEYKSAVKDYHQSDEFRVNPVPFSKTEMFRKIVTEYIYDLGIDREDDSETSMQCKDCGEEKTLDQFYFNKQAAIYSKDCKQCRNLHTRNYQRRLKGIQEDS
jgi:hypothetical protein